MNNLSVIIQPPNMKVLYLIAALLGVSSALQTRALSDDLIEFGNLFPVDEMGTLIQQHIDTDPETQEVLAYLKSEAFHLLLDEIAANPIWIDLKQYLLANGVDVEVALQNLHDLIENAGPSTPGTKGFSDLIDGLVALIPTDSLIIFLNDKLTNSPDFIAFWEKLTSAETKQLVEEVRALPEFVRIEGRLLEMGVDLQSYLDVLYLFLGWA